jgi:hypothetical protein
MSKKCLTSRMTGVSVQSLLKGGMREKGKSREAKVNISNVCAEDATKDDLQGPMPVGTGGS